MIKYEDSKDKENNLKPNWNEKNLYSKKSKKN
jgi:hypothetical protein